MLEGQEAAVVSGYEAGMTIDQLAEAFGCSAQPIRRVLLGAGVELRPTGRQWPFDSATEERIKVEYEAGATIDELVSRYGGTNRSVRAALVRRGASIRPTGRRPG